MWITLPFTLALIAPFTPVVAGPSIQGLGDLQEGINSSSALAVSSDGRTVVGFIWSSDPGLLQPGSFGIEAMRWTAMEGMVGLARVPGG